MKTSNLKVHLTGNLRTPSDPFARLIYGNVEIQIPYLVFIKLKIDMDINNFCLTRDLFTYAQDEIAIEMRHDMNGREELDPTCWHRDNPQKCSFNHRWETIPIRILDADYIQTDSKVKPDHYLITRRIK